MLSDLDKTYATNVRYDQEVSFINELCKPFCRYNLSQRSPYHMTLKTWNNPGENDIEAWSYHDLWPEEVVGIQALGIDEEMWDCHINHYAGYWWEDIESYGYSIYLNELGWNEGNYDGDESSPESDEKWWDQLTEKERVAATQLCYTRELWNAVPISDW